MKNHTTEKTSSPTVQFFSLWIGLDYEVVNQTWPIIEAFTQGVSKLF